jgi:hypothetical protein
MIGSLVVFLEGVDMGTSVCSEPPENPVEDDAKGVSGNVDSLVQRTSC